MKRDTFRALPKDIAELALLDVNDVSQAVRMSRSWIYAEVKSGRLPPPIKYGHKCSRWRAQDIKAYLAKRSADHEGAFASDVDRPLVRRPITAKR